MHSTIRIAVAGVIASLLLGCAGAELDRARGTSPSGTAFDKDLYKGYVTIASWEQGEADYEDADNFAMRAIASAGGKAPGPEAIDQRALPAAKVAELSDARQRLVTALAAGARGKAPAEAAHAQVMFDCWMQEQEENFQPSDIAKCRGAFMTAIAQVEDAVRPKPMAKAKPAPKPMARKAKFLVYFPFDSAKITPDSDRIILNAIDAAKRMGAKRIAVTGHADRSGAQAYNMALSDKRSKAVVEALTKSGLSARLINIGSFGESIPAVRTSDEVRMRENRRVEIEISN